LEWELNFFNWLEGGGCAYVRRAIKKDPETTNVSGAELNAILLDRRLSMELRIREHLTVVNAEVVPRRKLRLVRPFVERYGPTSFI
jgi:hypothetical protein